MSPVPSLSLLSFKTSRLNNNTILFLKSTLLLKMECFETHFYMKTECLQTK